MHTNLIIIGLFLALNILIGLYHAKGVKTFKDYAVGNGLSTFVIVCSLVASISHIGTLGEISDYYFFAFKNLIFFVILLSTTYFGAKVLTIRMSEFLGDFSIAESMGKLYGPLVRKITAITVVLVMLGLVVAQLKTILEIVDCTFSGMAQGVTSWVAIAIGFVVIVYAVFGGARSIAMTDVFQFLFFGCTLPLIAFLLLRYSKISIVEGWATLKQLPQFVDHRYVFSTQSLEKYFFFGVRVWLIILSPLYIQRLYMSKSVQQAKKALSNGAVTFFCIILLIFFVAIALHLGGHTLEHKHDVIKYLINLTHIPGIKAIILITVLALLMSTIDSALHLLSVVFVHDLWPSSPFKGLHGSMKKLQAVRITILVIGILALYSALSYKGNIYKLIAKGTEIYIPVVSIPWAMAILGFRPRRAVVLITMAISGIFVLYSRFTHYYTYHEANINLAIAMMISLSSLILGHYLLPKQANTGWIGIKDRNPLDLQSQENKRWWLRRLQAFKILASPKYWETLFPKNVTTFIILGVHLIIHTLISLWFMQKTYFFPYIYWYIAVMVIGTLLAIYPALHAYKQRGNRILHNLWPGLLFVLLFISSIQFAKLGHFGPMVCALVMVNIGLAIFLLSLKIGVGMLLLAMIIHQYIPPILPFWELFWAGYKEISIELIFALPTAMAALIGFSLYKYLSKKGDVRLNVIELARTYERKAALEATYSQVNWSRLDPNYGSEMLQAMGQTLEKPCAYLYKQGQEKLGEAVKQCIQKLSLFNRLLLKNAKEARRLGLNKENMKLTNIEERVFKAHSIIRALEEPMQLLLRKQTETNQLFVDPDLFERYLTINLLGISNSEQAINHIVTLTITDTMLRYDYTKAVPSSQTTTMLPALAFFISTSIITQSALSIYDVRDEISPIYLPKSEKELYQAESRQIVEAHGGYFEVIENKEVLTCLYVFPVAGEKVMHFKNFGPKDLTSDPR
ncbi:MULTISPECIES: sodium:solute symporter family protein [Candidatus Cardinium]|uniref:sodium:solute symporter family protein n=1 Tax=Candidatus Cardinium TaxID=273135 RepID=UPI001FA95810|nr:MULTISPECIES: sodium:solute symporter family protein [Cardinium]